MRPQKLKLPYGLSGWDIRPSMRSLSEWGEANHLKSSPARTEATAVGGVFAAPQETLFRGAHARRPADDEAIRHDLGLVVDRASRQDLVRTAKRLKQKALRPRAWIALLVQ